MEHKEKELDLVEKMYIENFDHISSQGKSIASMIDESNENIKSKLWKSGQTFALTLLFMLGTVFILIGIYAIKDKNFSMVITSIGITIGPSALLAQLYRVFFFDEIKLELNKPLRQMNGMLELISDLGELVKPLKDEVLLLKQATENGLLNIYPNRAVAIKKFINDFDSEKEEIMIIGSSLRGLLQDEEYLWFKEKLASKVKSPAFPNLKILFLLTHPCVADLRGRLETRDATEIGEDIIDSLNILHGMGVPTDNIRLYKGTPTIFGIKTKYRMLINPYPYKSQGMDSPCLILAEGKGLFESYREKHFKAWNSVFAERITNFETTVIQLKKNLKHYRDLIDKVLEN